MMENQMIDFSEYCEIADILGKIQVLDESHVSNCEKKVLSPQLLMMCAVANDIQEDDAYFEALMKNADLPTLVQLAPYFAEGTKISNIISDRICLFQKYRNNEDSFLDENAPVNGNSFYLFLCEWMSRKGFKTDSAFYNKAHISRQTFNKFVNGKAYKSADAGISRDMALHLAVGLGLNYDECVEFLEYCGYCLRANNKREQIISYFIRKPYYKIEAVNEALYAFHEKPLYT